MAGDYQVEFAFDETASLTEGYTPRAPYRAKAVEHVLVLEDEPGRISLQHILVVERDGRREPLKHWRQDWTFEDTGLLEFRGHQSWERRTLSPAQARCTWSQAVFEVDDGPRYEGVGRWTHERGISSWQSEETWRPLPRREYTKRSDYDVLVGTNRHALTPTGWVHEQDSLKVVLGASPHALVRERATNLYTRRLEPQGLPEASAYWKETHGFWSGVREEWQALFQAHPRFTLTERTGGETRSRQLLGLAASYRDSQGEGSAAVSPEVRQQIRSILHRFLGGGFAASTESSAGRETRNPYLRVEVR